MPSVYKGKALDICYTIIRGKAMPEKKQKTQTGYEIPIPKKDDFLKNLDKATKKSVSNSPKK
jgi:hypothetical protein